MRKEVVVVIIIGVAIGAIVAYGVYIAQSAITKRQLTTQPTPSSQEPIPTPPLHTLTILEPANESIVEEEAVQLVGKTSPSAVVTIISEENEYLLTSDKDGNFSATVMLVGGDNTLVVSAFDNEGNKAEQTLTLVYSTEL